MRLSEICIERPVFATVLSLVLIVFGYIGYSYLDTRYFPEVPEPYAQVSVHYAGASPTLMANQVTRILENYLVNVAGVAEMHSTSSYNYSNVYLTFTPGSNLIQEMGAVRDAVSSARDQLPTDIDPLSITSGGVLRPVLNIGFMDPRLSSAQIRDYVTRSIQPQLMNLPGMGGVWLYGASAYALRVWLDPQRMAAFGVTVTDVSNTLLSNNIDFAGGSILGKDRNYSIVSNTRLHTPQQFANLVIRDNNGEIVRLGDVADVQLGSQSLEDSPMRINGKPAIDMELRPLDTANPITVAREAKAALARIQQRLPQGMTMLVTYDQSIFLKAAIDESFKTLSEAIVLVMLVVFLFLGSLRAALVPIVTIPVCVIGVFGVMLLAGFSINVMTLLAMILAIGLVVDDAIVVLENTHRHIEEGLTPFDAAVAGIREIGFAVIAMNLTLAAVYAPTGFSQGFTATVFREFAFTLAGSVLISGFVALTLSPMMCARVLRPLHNETKLEHLLERIFVRINALYDRLLIWSLVKRYWVVGSLALLALLGYFVYLSVPQTFIPKEDIGYFETNINSPPGSTIDYIDGYMREIEKIYAGTPEILSYADFIFTGNATNFVSMQAWNKRKYSTQEVLQRLQPQLNALPGVMVDASVPDPISYGPGTDGSEVQIHVMTSGTYEDLEKTMDALKAKLQTYPQFYDVQSSLRFDSRVFEASFKRNEAASLGVSLQDVADTMGTLLGGRHITDIQTGSQTYNVMVQMRLQDLSSFAGLDNIYVHSSTPASDSDPNDITLQMILLSNLVTLHTAIQQTNMNRYNRMASADLTAQLAPNTGLNNAVTLLNSILNNTLTPDEQFAYGGPIQAYLTSSGTMLLLFALSIVFIYLVLAAQFESFVDPFIILLTVPLCIVAAIATLKVSGGSLNLYTNIGLITLVGLITKHGILITQFANTRLLAGDDIQNAIRHAALTRLRPILMTTFAMVLGALPLALATGPGSVSHRQIGWVIVGGMLFGTVFSLIVVPVAYSFLARFDHKKKKLLNL